MCGRSYSPYPSGVLELMCCTSSSRLNDKLTDTSQDTRVLWHFEEISPVYSFLHHTSVPYMTKSDVSQSTAASRPQQSGCVGLCFLCWLLLRCCLPRRIYSCITKQGTCAAAATTQRMSDAQVQDLVHKRVQKSVQDVIWLYTYAPRPQHIVRAVMQELCTSG